mgnify:CR=1 FL=1
MLTKDEKILHFSMLLLTQINPPLKARLNVNQLAAQLGVSRPWVYKYFGSSTEAMFLTAIDAIAPMLTELGKPTDDIKTKRDWAKSFLKGLDQTLQEVEAYPDLFRFYFACHVQPTIYLDRIRHHEGLFLEHKTIPPLKSIFGLSYLEARNFAEMLMATRMGLVLKWLNEPHRTPQARQKLVSTLRLRVFNQ